MIARNLIEAVNSEVSMSYITSDVLNPNCSELVVRLGTYDKKVALKKLKQIGIVEKKRVKGFWDFDKPETSPSNDIKNLLVDIDNPNSPDYAHHSTIHLEHDPGSGDRNAEWCVVGDQHCQSQLFATFYKVASNFGTEVSGYDGGSSCGYDDWVAEGRKPIENFNKKYIKDKEFLLLEPPKAVKKKV